MLSIATALRMPKGDALLAHILKVSRAYLHAHPEQILLEKEQQEFLLLQQRLAIGEPLAYLTGHQEFWSLDFKVTKDVLIPRPETEILVESVLEIFDEKPLTLVDLGTGSGAIAISLASERPAWDITATDLSPKALQVAQDNAVRLNVSHIHFLESDWFSNVPKTLFDVIVANPPYVGIDDPHLEKNVRDYEPHSALFSEDDGLADLTRIIKDALFYLKPGGYLFLEHGFQQAERIRRIFAEVGYTEVKSKQDLGGLDRVTFAKK